MAARDLAALVAASGRRQARAARAEPFVERAQPLMGLSNGLLFCQSGGADGLSAQKRAHPWLWRLNAAEARDRNPNLVGAIIRATRREQPATD